MSLDAGSAAVVASTTLGFAVLLPQAFPEGRLLPRFRRELACVTAVAALSLGTTVLLCLLYAPAAPFTLAIGVWTTAFGYAAFQFPQTWWLWQWRRDRPGDPTARLAGELRGMGTALRILEAARRRRGHPDPDRKARPAGGDPGRARAAAPRASATFKR